VVEKSGRAEGALSGWFGDSGLRAQANAVGGQEQK